MKNLLIYGVYGYTGELILEEALTKGMKPVVAGRNKNKTKAIAEKHGLEWRSFSIDDDLEKHLNDIDIFVNAAGPFSKTADPIVEACIKYGCHYFDITGEAAVFESIMEKSDRAREKGVLLVPGMGFDVVPTDCIAARLHELMPDAKELELSFSTKGKPSAGTAKTAKEVPFGKTLLRRHGELKSVPLFSVMKETIPYLDEQRCGIAIPWGDLVTAHWTTGIDNITVYFGLPSKVFGKLRALSYANRFVQSLPFIPKLLDSAIKAFDRKTTSETNRSFSDCQLWGRAYDGSNSIELRAKTPDGYILTARTVVAGVERLAKGDAKVKSGYATPSQLFGWDFLKSFDSVVWEEQELKAIAS